MRWAQIDEATHLLPFDLRADVEYIAKTTGKKLTLATYKKRPGPAAYLRATDSVNSAALSATDVDHADTLSQHSDLIKPSTSRSGRLNSGDELIKTDAGVGTRL